MMRKITGLLLVWLIALSAVGWAAQYPLTVAELAVEGNDEIKLRDILEVVPFKKGDIVEEADLRAGSQAIFELGWFDEVSMDQNALDEGRVVYKVTENPVVREIVVSGNINRRDYNLFGIKLFDAPIMPTFLIRNLLWQNEVRKGNVLSQTALMTGLEEIKAQYQSRGYPLIYVGAGDLTESLGIEIVELKYSGSIIEGLREIPESFVQDQINIPVDRPLQMADISRTIVGLSQSIYFSNVEVTHQQGLDRDRFWLRWTLDERALLTSPEIITSIAMDGNTIYSASELESLVGDLPEQAIGNFELLGLLEGIYDRYTQAGYTRVELSVAGVEAGKLSLHIEEGKISEIIIAGNTRTHEYVISRNSELEVGDILNQNDLLVTYQQLMALGYFANVEFADEWSDSGVVVTLKVVEKSDLGGFGGSMAIDPSTGELFGELSLNEKNVFGTGQDLELSYSRGLVGTEDLSPSTWNLGYSTVAYFPGFDRVGVNLYQKTEEVEVDEIMALNITLGTELSFSYPLADFSGLGLAFRHEEEHISNEAHWTPTDVFDVALSYDDTDNPFFPTQGSRRRISVEKAGGFSAGREYTKFDLTWVHFVPITMSLIGSDMEQALGIRIKTGWGDPQVPVSQQVELGGSTSIRGVSGAPARQYVFANAEYRLQLADGLYATAFWDGGFDLGTVRIKDILSSFGFELGINAAGIIMRLDFAWALNRDFNWIPVFDFGFGQMF